MKGIEKAIQYAGTQMQLAELLGCSQKHISAVLNGTRRCTCELAIKIEAVTDHHVLVEELCPEVPWRLIREHRVNG